MTGRNRTDTQRGESDFRYISYGQPDDYTALGYDPLLDEDSYVNAVGDDDCEEEEPLTLEQQRAAKRDYN
ncbi:hypothetical protein PP_21 [Cyanophage PP]|uniref:Uncharacterized protein n=1 Tax=Cyanophage PP TaxID=434346 RepID=U5PVN4_9CAUD|nr:hypothetical protein V420_gp21 [Cyanophage PP]AGY46488.1 hypothetical protein PP_21 [Cyanophage PP]